MIHLRAFEPGDGPVLLDLFRNTIRRVNSRDYNADQIRAWASDEIDVALWTARFVGRFALVAEELNQAVGFADLEPSGHIDRFFVSADHQRRGVGALLLATLIAETRRWNLTRVFTEASITARPFFEAQGFTALAEQVVECRGEEFVNFRMEMALRPHSPSDTAQTTTDGALDGGLWAVERSPP